MNELLPCPFCGNDVGEPLHSWPSWEIHCDKCDLMMHVIYSRTHKYSDLDLLITRWNTRKEDKK